LFFSRLVRESGLHDQGESIGNNGKDSIWSLCYIQDVAWEVEFTDEFEQWWHTLSESEQGKDVDRLRTINEEG